MRDEHPPILAQRFQDNQRRRGDEPIIPRTDNTRAQDHEWPELQRWLHTPRRMRSPWTQETPTPTTQMADEQTLTAGTTAPMENAGQKHRAADPPPRMGKHTKTPPQECTERGKQEEPTPGDATPGRRSYRIQRHDGPEVPHPDGETVLQRGRTPEFYLRPLTADMVNRIHTAPRRRSPWKNAVRRTRTRWETNMKQNSQNEAANYRRRAK